MKKQITIFCLCLSLFSAGCATTNTNNAQKGAVLTSLAGAVAGSLIGGNKFVGAAVGAGAGAILGYFIGNELDKQEQQAVIAVADKGKSNETVVWSNPDTGKKMEITPQPPKCTQDGGITRLLTIRSEEGELIKVKAYKMDEYWKLYDN